VRLLSGIGGFMKITIKVKKVINNPIEYSLKLFFISCKLIYQSVSCFLYKILLKNFSCTSYVHYLASLRNHTKISIGKYVTINRNVNLWVGELSIGDHVQINPNTCIYGRVRIGNNVMIAPNCMIAGGNHGIDNIEIPMIEQTCTSKGFIEIGNDVWIASNSIILDGVKIGDGVVIGGGKCCH